MLGHEDVGHRVVIRRLVGTRDDRPLFADLLGELLAADETHFTVRTATGPVRVPWADVVAAKRVPDRRRSSATERLERIAAGGFPAPDTERLGDWLLRAADGWTNRGNSALAVGDPGRPLGAAVDAVVSWYRARRLPPRIAVPLPLGGRLTAELDRRGWHTSPTTLVQTAPVAPLAGAATAVRLDPEPPAAWLAAVGSWKGEPPAAARHLLTAVPEVRFAGGYDERGTAIATARGVVTDDWLGIALVWVHERHRRRGWARQLTGALAGWAAERGAARGYVQVDERNGAALAFYAGLGFRTHHGYVVRTEPRARAVG